MTDDPKAGNGKAGKIQTSDPPQKPWTGSGTGFGPVRRIGEIMENMFDWLAAATGWPRRPGDKG